MNKIKLFITVVILFSLLIFTNSLFSQAPIITLQPNQIIKCIGSSASTHLVAEGAATLQYQWYKNGNPYGANSSTLDFPSLSLADEGEYYCNVSNGEGNINSTIITVAVVDGVPVINSVTTENELVCIGTDNLIEVDYTGENASVTWYVLSDIVGYTNQLQITDAELENEGNYYCMVTNVCGQDISETINIDVVESAHIISQPTTQTICEGEDAIFNVSTEGEYINYIWYADNIMIVGETNDSYTLSSPTYPHSIEYKVVAYNVCNNDTSNIVYANINTYPDITGQPIDHNECFGNDVTLYAFATGTTASEYQWFNENNIAIDGETNTSITISIAENDTAHYYCAITNACGTVYTDTAEILTLMAPEITQQPIGGTLCVGDEITLQAKANGTDPLYYQWLFNGSNVSGTNISGEESQNVTIEEITEAQEGIYTCHVSNVCGYVITEDAEVIVNTPPLVTEQPEGIVVCEAEELQISFNHSGTEPISFEWYILETETLISSEANYYTDNTNPENSGSYYCVLTNTCGEISTDTIDISILALPQITTHPTDESVCVGEFASMSIEALGAEPLNYLWYRNESSVSGQTNSILEYPSAQVNQTGTYFCRVANICGYDDSETAELSIGTEPSITWNPIDQTLCEHDTLNLIMDAQGDNYTLQWYYNDSPISGENDTILKIININESMNGTYYCSAFNSCAVVNTDTVNVLINPAPIMSLGNDIDLCEGDTTTLSASGNYSHYNWNNGLSNQPELEIQLGGTFILEVTGENSCKTRDTIVVEFHPLHHILFSSEEITSCGTYPLNAGEGAYSYIWNTIPEQYTPSINITQSGTYSVTVSGDYFGCTSSRSVYVDVNEPISINLGEDLTVPVSSYVDIGIDPIYSTYIWNTGFEGPSLTVYGSTYGVGDHEFWLTAIADNNCTDTDTIQITFWDDSGIAINDEIPELFIYPNPSNGIFTINTDKNIISEIEVYNCIGEQLQTFAINSDKVSLNLSTFAKGVYIIKAKCLDKVFTKKILIN